MSDTVIKLDKLTKAYGKVKVVNEFNLEVKRGHIYGLIGPNGAGKTTIMKMMAGLTSVTKGSMEFFGDKNLDKNRPRMSFMIENPILDINMTARENLEYVGYLKGIPSQEKYDEILEFVGLGKVGKKRAGNFSLGMRQRLGIAMAIISEPEVLVLDEPVNGLDPEGIVDVRNLLTKLSQEKNVTILISSHLLSELSEFCTDYAIINHGQLVETISAEELRIKCENHITIKTDDIPATTAVLEQKLGIKEYKVVHNEEIHVFEKVDELMTISKTITDAGLTILKFVAEGANLEEYYLSKVGGEHA
ncbi:MAG: ABC transporter ATP-binding protein [Clostridia bacterium]|nr:ABC transporter ATP-binding protein [Clostridia bacterium]